MSIYFLCIINSFRWDPLETMRFNKQELVTLATQPSSKFEKEGVLHVRERQEGFFRKTESKSENVLPEREGEGYRK